MAGASLAWLPPVGAAGLVDRGHGASIDLFGERVSDPAVAGRAVADYLSLAAALPAPPADVWLSVDLSHLALGADPKGGADRLAAIAQALPAGRRVQIDAEEARSADAILSCVLEVAARDLADRLGGTVQANLIRSPGDADGPGRGGRLCASGQRRLCRADRSAPLRRGNRHSLPATGVPARRGGRAAWSLATHDARLREAVLLALR